MKRTERKKRVYMDYAAATPVDPKVVGVLNASYSALSANPSALYEEGVLSKSTLESSRKSIASLISSHSDEIVFTSGATESNNLAVIGVFESALKSGIKRPHIIVSSFEHPAVLEATRECQNRGAKISYIPVNPSGFVEVFKIRKYIKPETILISIMFANNELGTIQPIRDVAKEIRKYKKKKRKNTHYPYLHCDASQVPNYISINVQKLNVDLLSLDSGKIYGPKGVGAVFLKRNTKVYPMMFGGGQERGVRSGTENLEGILGFTKAMKIAKESSQKESARVRRLRDRLVSGILNMFPKAEVNGLIEFSLPNMANICFHGEDAEYLVIRLDALGISVSSSSSCRSIGENFSSYVIESIGKKDCAQSSIRFSLGRFSTLTDVERVLSALKKLKEQFAS